MYFIIISASETGLTNYIHELTIPALQICCYVSYATCNDSYAKPANAAIGGMNCTIIALFGVNLATAEAPPPLVIPPPRLEP